MPLPRELVEKIEEKVEERIERLHEDLRETLDKYREELRREELDIVRDLLERVDAIAGAYKADVDCAKIIKNLTIVPMSPEEEAEAYKTCVAIYTMKKDALIGSIKSLIPKVIRPDLL